MARPRLPRPPASPSPNSQQPIASSPDATATVEVVGDAMGDLVTNDYLDKRMAEQRAELFRALWIQGAGIVTVNAAIIAAVVTLALALD